MPLRRILAAVLLAALATRVGAESIAAVEKTALFAAGDFGYASFRIPAIVVTPQQAVLVAAEGRKNNRNDWGLIDLFYRRSADNGRTWGPVRPLVHQQDLPPDLAPNPAASHGSPRPPGLTISNATWISDSRQSRTFFIFCVEYLRCFILESPDGGLTFSKPREITGAFLGFREQAGYDWRVIATGPGHGLQLASGRLVVPVWLSTSDGGHAHRPSVSATIFSDDGGLTWQSGAIAAGRGDDVINPSETIIAEPTPGKVMLNIRNESAPHRRAVVWSTDGATNWSRPQYVDALWEPVCMASIIRLQDGALVFANPATLEPNPARPTAISLLRQNLSLRVSRDAGQTWSPPWVLEPGPSAYSDLAVAADGTILCFYEHGITSPYESLSLARIPPEALTSSRPR